MCPRKTSLSRSAGGFARVEQRGGMVVRGARHFEQARGDELQAITIEKFEKFRLDRLIAVESEYS